MRKSLFHIALLAVLVMPAVAGAQSAQPVVVELFTSQGCPACPPAGAYMRDLAARDDVIALEFHIDYYDYGGWKDPFGSADFTRRWQAYARELGARYEYTPFMVVGGARHEIGSARDTVELRIRELRDAAGRGPRLSLVLDGDQARIRVEGDGPPGVYDLIIAVFDGEHTTRVTAGENSGQTLVNANVVRQFRRIGQWAGEPLDISVPLAELAGRDGCAVLLQRVGGGPIIAAAVLDLST
jgi:hypothetical protein